jgi:D-sedoheptulose 7-phosphate isomerase
MDEVRALFKESAEVKLRFAETHAAKISEVVYAVVKVLRAGNKLLIFGNGGSAADAQHFAAEFVNRYLLTRSPLAAMALTTDSSVITSIGNDVGFDEVFATQIVALGRPGDLAWGITTSGKSPNIVRAFEAARGLGLVTLSFTGKGGGVVAALADYNFTVEAESTPRIQETQLTLGHAICELVEKRMAKT